MKIEILLVLNSLLVGICLYFIRDFHRDFKKITETVHSLKEKFTELSTTVKIQIQSIKARLTKIDQMKGED